MKFAIFVLLAVAAVASGQYGSYGGGYGSSLRPNEPISASVKCVCDLTYPEDAYPYYPNTYGNAYSHRRYYPELVKKIDPNCQCTINNLAFKPVSYGPNTDVNVNVEAPNTPQ